MSLRWFYLYLYLYLVRLAHLYSCTTCLSSFSKHPISVIQPRSSLQLGLLWQQRGGGRLSPHPTPQKVSVMLISTVLLPSMARTHARTHTILASPGVAAADYVSTSSSLPLARPFQKLLDILRFRPHQVTIIRSRPDCVCGSEP